MTKSTRAVGFVLALSLASISCSRNSQETVGTAAVASPAAPENRTSKDAAQHSVKYQRFKQLSG